MIRNIWRKSSRWFNNQSGLRLSTAHLLRLKAKMMRRNPSDLTPYDAATAFARKGALTSAADFAGISPLLTRLQPGTPSKALFHGVIVETREHPNLIPVIESFLVNTDMKIQIFHGEENEEFVKTNLAEYEDTRLEFVRLPITTLNAAHYNALMMSKEFWTAVSGRKKVLIFQTDTYACAASDYRIEDFRDFDYIGSFWPRKRPIGITCDGGNGGLSLRDWSKTLQCLDRFPPERWPGGEDGYFAFHIDLMGCRVGKPRDCAKFGTQYRFFEKSWGAHKLSQLPTEELAEFLEYCPPAARLLEG